MANEIKTVRIDFSDGYYEIKPGGDTIFGPFAHKVMHAMNKHFNYENVGMQQRIEFILHNYSLPE